MTLWSVLDPSPDTANGGLVFLFTALLLLLGGLSVAQELMLWARAERLAWGVRRLRARETTRRRRQVEEIAAEIALASPDLAGGARRLVDATVETNELVRLLRPAEELFEAALLRRSRGAVILPPSFLDAAPGVLGLLGLAGTAAALAGGLPAGQALSSADAAVVGAALHVLVWGLLLGGTLFAVGRFSRGRGEAAVEGLSAWLEQQLGVGESGGRGGGADRTLRSAAQQTQQTLAELLEQQQAHADRQQQALATLLEALQQPRPAALVPADSASAAQLAPAAAPSLDAEALTAQITRAIEAGMRAARPALREGDGLVVAGSVAAPAGLDPLWLDELSDRLARAVQDGLAAATSDPALLGVGLGGSSVDRETAGLVAELKGTVAELRLSAQRMGEAGAPVARAAESFLTASERLQRAVPQLDATAESYARSREALDQAAGVLRQGMEGYLQSSQLLRETVGELRDAQRATAAGREGWDEALDRVRRLVKDLGGLALELRQGAEQLGQVVTPAGDVARAFQQAGAGLAGVLPQIQAAAESYGRSREALDTASASLREGSSAYVAVSGEVRALVADLRGTQEAQRASLDGWTATVGQIGAAVGGLQAAAASLEQSATQTQAAMQPAAQTAQTFLAAAGALGAALPRLEGVSEAYAGSREALEGAAAALRAEASGYRAAGELIRQLVAELEAAHASAAAHLQREADTLGQSQQASAAMWGEATGQLQGVLGTLQETAGHLTAVSQSMAQATAPNLEAAQAFQAAAGSLQDAIPRIEATTRSQAQIQASLEAATTTLEVGMRGYQGVVDQAAASLATGTQGYVAAGAAAERMVAALEARHSEALAAAASQVEVVLSGPLREASSQLAAISASQAAHLEAWQAASGGLLGVLEGLREGTAGAGELAARFREAAEPAVASAEAFREAARRLTTLFPQLESSADGYDRINQALAAAAQELTRSSVGYREAGDRIGELTGELQRTLKLQVLGTREFSEAMDKASGFVQAIGPASERVERAAAGLHTASEQTAAVVQSIQGSVSVQDEAMVNMRTTAEQVLEAMQRQASHWGSFLSELDRLQSTINQSVEALTTRLPHSIDHTLVHFDAALGEGVARLGGSIERLREAMDDLQERLETLMVDSGRRR